MPRKLKPFFDAISDIPFKNCGGCLFFCYVFWLWLKKNEIDTKSFEIIQYDCDSREAIQQNEAWISGAEKNASSSWHFTWLYNKKEYDAENPVGKRYSPRQHETSVVLDGLNTKYLSLVEQFCLSALNESAWNTWFDREKAIEIIEERLGLDLSKVNKKSCR